MGKRELDALLSLSSWCLLIVVWLFLMVPWVCLQFVIVVFPDHTSSDYLTMSILRPPPPPPNPNWGGGGGGGGGGGFSLAFSAVVLRFEAIWYIISY